MKNFAVNFRGIVQVISEKLNKFDTVLTCVIFAKRMYKMSRMVLKYGIGNLACIPVYTTRQGERIPARLYSLKTDVAQEQNLAGHYPEKVKKMTRQLNEIKDRE